MPPISTPDIGEPLLLIIAPKNERRDLKKANLLQAPPASRLLKIGPGADSRFQEFVLARHRARDHPIHRHRACVVHGALEIARRQFVPEHKTTRFGIACLAAALLRSRKRIVRGHDQCGACCIEVWYRHASALAAPDATRLPCYQCAGCGCCRRGSLCPLQRCTLEVLSSQKALSFFSLFFVLFVSSGLDTARHLLAATLGEGSFPGRSLGAKTSLHGPRLTLLGSAGAAPLWRGACRQHPHKHAMWASLLQALWASLHAM